MEPFPSSKLVVDTFHHNITFPKIPILQIFIKFYPRIRGNISHHANNKKCFWESILDTFQEILWSLIFHIFLNYIVSEIFLFHEWMPDKFSDLPLLINLSTKDQQFKSQIFHIKCIIFFNKAGFYNKTCLNFKPSNGCSLVNIDHEVVLEFS